MARRFLNRTFLIGHTARWLNGSISEASPGVVWYRELTPMVATAVANLVRWTCTRGQSPERHDCTSGQIHKRTSIRHNVGVTAIQKDAVTEEVMKAVLALIVIYVATFLVAIQGASNTSVEASEQGGAQANPSTDPAKEKDIRSLLELVGARDTIQESATAATEQYRQRVMEASANPERAQKFTNAYLAEFQKKLDADAVTGQLVGIYDKHFTDEEIRELLEFYGSPLGQKVAAEMPKIARETQQATRSAGAKAARQAWQDLRAEDPSAGESPRPRAARRRGLGVNPQPQPAGVEQALADPQP
jgi:uncharacterized protein